ncbi:MAG: hypothetical protein LBU32_16110 [Clostridiales bacterium]|nr:hypothetical protein [Clostridiales bacterium]
MLLQKSAKAGILPSRSPAGAKLAPCLAAEHAEPASYLAQPQAMPVRIFENGPAGVAA